MGADHSRSGKALLFAGLLMITLGLLRGEAVAVMLRAVTICFECIGLG